VGAACNHHEDEGDPKPAKDLRPAALKLHVLSPVQQQCRPLTDDRKRMTDDRQAKTGHRRPMTE